MKKIYILIAIFCTAVFAAGCAKEAANAPEGTVLKASMSSLTKTAIAGVKVSWTAGDAICVNGTSSYPIQEGGATATFEFRNTLTAPYQAVYPASIYKNATTVSFPILIEADSFSVPLSGYLAEGDEISFNALTALIKLSITGETTTTVKDITLKGLGGEQISGDFTIDYQTGALTSTTDADAYKAVKVNVNKALSASPLVVYIPIPAGEYSSGYQIDILDTEGGVMRNTVSARTVSAGQLRQMPALVFEPNIGDDPNIGGIPSAQEFRDFASAVNDGRSIARWQNASGEVELLADIDLGGLEWTPIGNGSVTNAHAITGSKFTGVFDGKNHTVDNFKVTIPVGGGSVAGLFGIIEGATVKNLVIGSNAVIKTSSKTFVTMGGAVAFASESTLDNIDSHATLINDGGADNIRLVIGGAVGTMYSNTTSCTATNIKGHASFNVTNNINTKNGATGFIVGGVIGYMDGKDLDNAPTMATTIINYSSFSVQATRTAGVIGTINAHSIADGCINNGDIACTDTKATNSRPSGIASAMGTKTILKNSVNYGNISFPVSGDSTHGYCAGVVGQTNDNNEYVSSIEGCASYGDVLSDMYFGNKYLGIICADFNTKKVTVKNCILGGRIGPYTPTEDDPIITLNSDNFEQYYSMEAASRKANVVFQNNTFGTRP